MSKKHYIRSDGNGGINISKSLMAFLLFLFTALGLIVSVVAYEVGTKSELTSLQEEYAKHTAENSKSEADLYARATTNAQNIAILNTKVDDIQKTLGEIKIDVKEIKNGGK